MLTPTIELVSPKPNRDVLVDLSDTVFVDAFGVTYLAACFRRCIHPGRRVLVRPPNDGKVHRYLTDVGLYQEIGLGDRFQARQLSNDRVDLVHVNQLNPGFIDHLLDFLEQVQPFASGVRPSIRLALMELVQNFAEHSGSTDGAWICGQFVRAAKGTKRPRVTLCVLDLGVGISGRLRTAIATLRDVSDGEALVAATEDGVSSAGPERGRGLHIIRRFVRANGGTLTMISGKGRARLRPDRAPETWELDVAFPGSAIFLSLVPTTRGLYVV